jgi:hypothetical protein
MVRGKWPTEIRIKEKGQVEVMADGNRDKRKNSKRKWLSTGMVIFWAFILLSVRQHLYNNPM